MELYRTIDANINRLREGLRVIEDILRYQYNAAGLLPRIKDLRHSVADIDKLTFRGRISYRDALNDEGFDIVGSNESERTDTQDLLRANFLRCQEASRVLEELLKVKRYEKDLFQRLKKIRYSLYELEREVFLHFGDSHPRGIFLNLNFIAQSKTSKTDFTRCIEEAITGGVTSVILEGTDLSDMDFVKQGREVKEICKNFNIPFLIKSRIDVCLAVEADGVHLTETGISPDDARKILGKDKLIGISVSSIEQINNLNKLSIDYLMYDLVLPNKIDNEELINLIQGILDYSHIPLVFHVETKAANISKLRKAGAFNISVKDMLLKSGTPDKTAREFRK